MNDALAALLREKTVAHDACQALNCPPGELEARVRRLVEAGEAVFHSEEVPSPDEEHDENVCVWCDLRTALAEWGEP